MAWLRGESTDTDYEVASTGRSEIEKNNAEVMIGMVDQLGSNNRKFLVKQADKSSKGKGWY